MTTQTLMGGEIVTEPPAEPDFFDPRVAVLQSETATPEDKEAAFTEIVQEYWRPMEGVALRIAKNPEDAQEITQESLLKAWLHIDHYKPTGTLQSWLMKITQNTSLNRHRHDRRDKRDINRTNSFDQLVSDTPNFEAEGMAGIAAGKVESPEEAQERAEQELRIANAIAAINPVFAEPLFLAEHDDLLYKEIAEKLGLPIGTVMSRIHRAKRQFRSMFTEEELVN